MYVLISLVKNTCLQVTRFLNTRQSRKHHRNAAASANPKGLVMGHATANLLRRISIMR